MMGMGWMMVGMLLFWGVLIFLAVLLVRALFASRDDRPLGSQDAASPMAILDLRYSRGEITREQYLQMRRDLEDTDRG